LQWVLNLGRLQEHTQQGGGREICDTESLADKIRAVLPLLLDAVKSCSKLFSLILWRNR
jgi:hypothetical protein